MRITGNTGNALSVGTFNGTGDAIEVANFGGANAIHVVGGNVQIGESNSPANLQVNGNVQVTGDILLSNADCAEEFEISTPGVEPGTVMVLNESGNLEQSYQAYDKKVAGVVSGAGNYKPGIIFGNEEKCGNNNTRPIALVGKTYCKVDATYGAIETGDLLTTSATSGHAMKATDPLKAFGSVIGKALSSLKTGTGLIPILIALQ